MGLSEKPAQRCGFAAVVPRSCQQFPCVTMSFDTLRSTLNATLELPRDT